MKWYNRKVRSNLRVLRNIIKTSVKVVPYVRRIQRIRRILGRSRNRIRTAIETQNYRQLIFIAKGLKAAAKILIKTGLLEQFELAKTLLYDKV